MGTRSILITVQKKLIKFSKKLQIKKVQSIWAPKNQIKIFDLHPEFLSFNSLDQLRAHNGKPPGSKFTTKPVVFFYYFFPPLSPFFANCKA